MKLIRTYGKTAAQAEAILRQIEGRSGAATSRLEPVVKRIIADMRRKGDTALRRYAEKFDGLAPRMPARYAAKRWRPRGMQIPEGSAQVHAGGGSKYSAFARWQMPKEWTRKLPGVTAGSARACRWTQSAAMFPAGAIRCLLPC